MNQTAAATPVVEMRGISKAFGAVQALDDVSLHLQPGEILGLVGDNSAGKSTLMKVMSGAYTKDQGHIMMEGREVQFSTPHDSRARGIEMIYQDFALCGNMDVASNMFLGRWPTRGLFIDKRKMEAEARKVLDRLRVEIASVNLRVESLSGGRQQLVAIARAVSFDPKVLILDEPTANLSVPATERLLELMLDLKSHGVAQIIISHRLQDIFAVGDRVMVLKRGRAVGDRRIRDTTEDEILGLIVQGDVVEQTARE
jgi:simple sugar transport system ATP-binding protein